MSQNVSSWGVLSGAFSKGVRGALGLGNPVPQARPPSRKVQRAKNLANLFDPEKGHVGEFFDLFIQYVQEVSTDDALAAFPMGPLKAEYCDAFDHDTSMGHEITYILSRRHEIPVTHPHFPAVFVNNYIYNLYTRFYRPVERLSPTKVIGDEHTAFSNIVGIFKKLVDRERKKTQILEQGLSDGWCEKFRKFAHWGNEIKISNAFRQNNVHIFPRDPSAMLGDTIETMQQVVAWACAQAESKEEINRILDGLLQPTITSPYTKELITPLEMLGRADNGLIVDFMARRCAIKINGNNIINSDCDENTPLFNRDFVEYWYQKNRKLEVGGCPALTHRKKAGEIYMNFGRMYIDLIKRTQIEVALKYGSEPILVTEEPYDPR